MAQSESPNYESGECPNCGDEYVDLRKHWSLSTSCSAPSGRGTFAVVECANCGMEHKKERYELRDNENTYCSPECRDEGIRTGEMVECSNCGTEVYKPECHLSEMGDYGIDHHFCDKECEQEWKRANWVRENHPHWQGGSGGINAIRQAFAENSWNDTARRYREQHEGGCEVCGGSTDHRKLDIHHIVPLAAGGTNADWNLMAVCHSCHRRAESFIREHTTPHIYRLADGE